MALLHGRELGRPRLCGGSHAVQDAEGGEPLEPQSALELGERRLPLVGALAVLNHHVTLCAACAGRGAGRICHRDPGNPPNAVAACPVTVVLQLTCRKEKKRNVNEGTMSKVHTQHAACSCVLMSGTNIQ